MHPSRRTLLAAGLAALLSASLPAAASAKSAHDFAFTSIEGEPLPMQSFAGKAVLLVNTASFCGFTPQYEGLQALWQSYRDRGLVVLGVPSNDFGDQEPGSNREIKQFCELTFAVDFPMTEKQPVTGATAHPLYRWIAAELGDEGRPTWNFHKFLINPEGEVVAAWPSRTTPADPALRTAIEDVLPR
ncbi:MAG: glutathione peroxidase [Kiloniellales bacterium]